MKQLIDSFNYFITKEAASGIILFFATVAAVVVANSSLGEAYYALWHLPLGVVLGDFSISMDLTHWIDDGLMALFFLMVGLEIKRELLIGELSDFRRASFPVMAAIGGMAVPALIYVGLNPSAPLGFGIPMATDIAFALGILMLLGKRVDTTLKLFLVALAVVDDLGAVLVVAVVYTDQLNLIYLFYSAVVYGLIWAMHFLQVKKLFPYLLMGVVLWIFIHKTGVHATVAGVLLAFAIPIKSKMEELHFVEKMKGYLEDFKAHIDPIPMLNHHQVDALENIAYSYDRVQNPLVRLEHNLHGLSAFFIMPLFAFSNAGVVIDFSSVSTHFSIVSGVVLGLLIGKPVGIFGLTWLAEKIGLVQKPDSMSWMQVLAVGFLGGIGFTMSIFITHLAFADETLIDAVKLGVFMASFFAGVIGVALLLKTTQKS